MTSPDTPEMSEKKTDLAAMAPDQRALWEARDIILAAATSLECGQPQHWFPSSTAKLRRAADLLTKLDAEADTYINELGANSRGEFQEFARYILLKQRLRSLVKDVPEYMTELKARLSELAGSADAR